jgi:hypothetical protein
MGKLTDEQKCARTKDKLAGGCLSNRAWFRVACPLPRARAGDVALFRRMSHSGRRFAGIVARARLREEQEIRHEATP